MHSAPTSTLSLCTSHDKRGTAARPVAGVLAGGDRALRLDEQFGQLAGPTLAAALADLHACYQRLLDAGRAATAMLHSRACRKRPPAVILLDRLDSHRDVGVVGQAGLMRLRRAALFVECFVTEVEDAPGQALERCGWR